MDMPVAALPSPVARLAANVLITGHGGGRDLNLRTLRRDGVTLAGHFLGASNHEARFAPDLNESVAWGDERHAQFMQLVDSLVRERGLEPPELEPFGLIGGEGPERLDLRDFGCVVFAAGFRPDYGSWLPWPHAFDELGFPRHEDGQSAAVPGLFFAGVHFLRKRKSSLLVGVGEDAAIVAQGVAARVGA
jgi:putative flavoprotein involved in K+ transport